MSKAITSPEAIPSENEFKKAVGDLKAEFKKMKRMSEKEGALLLPAQAAAMMGVSPQAVERKMREGAISSFRIMGKVWVSGNQVTEIMNERIRSLVRAGEDKNIIEQRIYKRMYLNAKAMKGKSKA